jgi:thiol-disulfide isomerase/thioredoxin
MNKIKTIVLIALLLLISIAIGTQANLTKQTSINPYDGQLRVYIAEPQSRWDNYNDDPYHYAFLDFAINEELSIDYLETYITNITWNAIDAGYKNVKQDNIIAIAAVFNPEINQGYANPPSKNPFDAYYVDAAAGATPGNTGYNQVTENFTHTVFAEEATATWCPYCPAMAEALNNVYQSGDYPFYFVALVADENDNAEDRLVLDYNLYGYPTTFFDGGYKVLVGGYDQESYYKTRIVTCGKRDVHDLDLSISVQWLGEGVLGIEVSIKNTGNSAPLKPTIDGPDSGRIKSEIEYAFVTTDPDSDDIYYCINWSDNSGEVWLGPYKSGEELKLTHSWTEEGTYTIRVKAKDIYDFESDWAELEVSMPKTKIISLNRFVFLDRILEIIYNIASLKNL